MRCLPSLVAHWNERHRMICAYTINTFRHHIGPLAIAPCRLGISSAPCLDEPTPTPSTVMTSPQTNRLAALARNTAGPAKSSGFPHRFPGVPTSRFFTNPSSFLASTFLQPRSERTASPPLLGMTYISVATDPGAMALTLMLCRLHSLLSALVSWVTAPFDAVYDATRAPPMKELREAMLMIFPRRRGIMCRPADWQRMKREFRLTFRT